MNSAYMDTFFTDSTRPSGIDLFLRCEIENGRQWASIIPLSITGQPFGLSVLVNDSMILSDSSYIIDGTLGSADHITSINSDDVVPIIYVASTILNLTHLNINFV